MRRQLVRGVGSLWLAWALTPLAPAWGRISAGYRIVSASYGSEQRRVDVTQRLRELARQQDEFILKNEVFGQDPHPGQQKVLRIEAVDANGRSRTFSFAEGGRVDGRSFSNWRDGDWGLAAVAAAGASGRDAFQILRASYGTPERNIDVTDKLRELARSDQRFRLRNETFGSDPHPGRPKTLRIFTRSRNGLTKTFEYAEGQWVDGVVFSAWSGGRWGDANWNGGWDGEQRSDYRIVRAHYGTPERNIDVTHTLRELARSGQGFQLENRTFGADPHPGRAKSLRIVARGPDGRTKTFDYPEGAWVDGGPFSGWRSGGWGESGSGDWSDGAAQTVGEDERLRILRADYGVVGQSQDIAPQLRSQIRDGKLSVKIDNKLAGGDPAPGQAKQLAVRYSVLGREQRKVVNESQVLSLP